jgi:hypothetical protein
MASSVREREIHDSCALAPSRMSLSGQKSSRVPGAAEARNAYRNATKRNDSSTKWDRVLMGVLPEQVKRRSVRADARRRASPPDPVIGDIDELVELHPDS